MKNGDNFVKYHGILISEAFLARVAEFLGSFSSLSLCFCRVSIRRGYHPVDSFRVDESNYGKSSFVTVHVPTLLSNIRSRNAHFVLRFKVSRDGFSF